MHISHPYHVLGGYYSVELSKKLRLLCLNTALYYHTNNITLLTDAYDPSGQLSWLASQLEDAKLAHQRVTQLLKS